MTRTVCIVGAGPAGLTAALELLRHDATQKVFVFEADTQVGGISKTVNYRGNRMDLGGHRFFSKSDWVMNWWQDILPVAGEATDESIYLAYQQQNRLLTVPGLIDTNNDNVMLVRPRLSRILYRRRFFDYPLRLNIGTVRNLGLASMARIGLSYARSRLAPRTPERTLEDFFVNRFGANLYRTFFKDYTEKVWGVPCREISAEWGAQRVKGLSITRALAHAVSSAFRARSIAQKDVETSLIERFLYPRLGPGQMWERVATLVQGAGGSVHLNHKVTAIRKSGQRVTAVDVLDTQTNTIRTVSCDALISTMPLAQLTTLLGPDDSQVGEVARNLPYRDFMTAGLVVKQMKPPAGARHAPNGMPPDNWIYIQEPDVHLGRLQIFNNWSPHLVADPSTISLGLEYFCREGDALWSRSDSDFLDFAARELEQIDLIDRRNILDGTVVRVPKAYPAYFGEYREIHRVRNFLDSFDNLYPVGRNGMHRYNNQDHSMLAAKAAVNCIVDSNADKKSIWAVNSEDEYHEEVRATTQVKDDPAKRVEMAA